MPFLTTEGTSSTPAIEHPRSAMTTNERMPTASSPPTPRDLPTFPNPGKARHKPKGPHKGAKPLHPKGNPSLNTEVLWSVYGGSLYVKLVVSLSVLSSLIEGDSHDNGDPGVYP